MSSLMLQSSLSTLNSAEQWSSRVSPWMHAAELKVMPWMHALNARQLSHCMRSASCLENTMKHSFMKGMRLSRKAVALDNKVFQIKTTGDLYPLLKQSAQAKTPAASPVSVVATEVKTLPLEKLKTGFLKFKENYQKDPALVKKLAEGQEPPYMIIACADSRVDPCTVLNLGPGEAFVLRNIGNMVPPYSGNSCSSTASAIEFAVLILEVKHLIIIGHSRCGAIRALMGMQEDGSNRFSEFIEDWVLVSKGASRKVKSLLHGASFEDQCACCEKEAVNHSLWNCLSFPFVREKIASGELSLHGGYYDFVNCTFEHWSLDVSSLENVEKVQ